MPLVPGRSNANNVGRSLKINEQGFDEARRRMHVFRAVVLALVVVAAGCRTGPPIEFVRSEGRIDVMIGGKLFTSYRYGEDLPKPILYPLRTPSGITVNRGFPIVKVAGETTDHPHHAGLFFACDRVNGNDFWNHSASGLPKVRHIDVLTMKSGRGKGELVVAMQWIDKNGRALLRQKWRMVFRAENSQYLIDSTIDLEAVDRKVVFEDTKEGLFGIRVADWLREKGGTGRYLSSAGDVSPVNENIWGKRARWVSLQGRKDDRIVGVAIFNHPTSVNYPTYWHARPYGLFAANPLGQAAFEKKRHPGQAKALNLTLDPGRVAHFRFLVVIYEGDRTLQQLEEQFSKYAGGRVSGPAAQAKS